MTLKYVSPVAKTVKNSVTCPLQTGEHARFKMTKILRLPIET